MSTPTQQPLSDRQREFFVGLAAERRANLAHALARAKVAHGEASPVVGSLAARIAFIDESVEAIA